VRGVSLSLCWTRPARSESTFARAVHSRSHIHTHTETTAGCSAGAVLKRRLSFPLVFFCPYRDPARCSAVAELVKTAYHVFPLTLQIHTQGRWMYVLHSILCPKVDKLQSSAQMVMSRTVLRHDSDDRSARTYFKWSGKVICPIQEYHCIKLVGKGVGVILYS
jgi:hypothetical protein